jgi:hypothetical protein
MCNTHLGNSHLSITLQTALKMLICARVLYKHTTLGIKKASIRIMGGKGGFLVAPRYVEGPGVLKCSKVNYWYYIIRRAAVLPGGQRQCAGGYSSHRGMSGYYTEATRRYIIQ